MDKKHKNFSDADKLFLVEIIKDKRGIIENKGSDSEITSKKAKAWKDVLAEYNSRADIPRDMVQIKGCWKRMKIRSKNDVARFKRAQKQTGGGHQPDVPDTLSHSCSIDVTKIPAWKDVCPNLYVCVDSPSCGHLSPTWFAEVTLDRVLVESDAPYHYRLE